ncbi:MAG: hypothetical protein ACR2PG_18280 [Hyphomicrobiaceae bacterium]
MMGRIFLGKPWHWVMIIAATGLLWFCGSKRFHVIEFNFFVIAMFVGTAILVALVIWFHSPGEQVTREILVDHSDDTDYSAILDRD